MKKSFIFILLFIIVAGLVSFVFKIADTVSKNTYPIACTMEAKLCSDGSAVSRTGPKCEFAACPQASSTDNIESKSGNVTLVVGQEGKIGDVTIKLNIIVQDSRCPKDVQCIQAGSVNLNITLTDTTRTETIYLSSYQTPYVFNGHKVSIISILPDRISKKEISDSEYKVTFHIQN